MAYDPITGRYTPDVKPLSGGLYGPTPVNKGPSNSVDQSTSEAMQTVNEARAAAYEAAALTGSEIILNAQGKLVRRSPAVIKTDPVASPINPAAAVDSAASADALALQREKDKEAADNKRFGQSAFDLLKSRFNQFGLGSLVDEVRYLVTSGAGESELTLALRETTPYKIRFAANAKRISNGLAAISEAEYVGLEDQYQNVMRQYGLPASYYEESTDAESGIKTQVGFQKFLESDISPVELEDRIQTAQNRVTKSNPEVLAALKSFYPDITNGDILAYTLDPKNAISNIKRKVSAAEIGGAAVASGLKTNVSDAAYLESYGVDKAQAQQGYSVIAGGLQRGSQLASIYGQDPYTQSTAEQEVFNVPGATEAANKRKKITGLETAAFGGQSGLTSGALARDKAGSY
jgi:hypothetical protein